MRPWALLALFLLAGCAAAPPRASVVPGLVFHGGHLFAVKSRDQAPALERALISHGYRTIPEGREQGHAHYLVETADRGVVRVVDAETGDPVASAQGRDAESALRAILDLVRANRKAR